MSPDNMNKVIGTGMVAIALGAAVYFGVAHIASPEIVTITIGGVLGLGSHLLGVGTGASTTLKGIDTANSASVETILNSTTGGNNVTTPSLNSNVPVANSNVETTSTKVGP